MKQVFEFVPFNEMPDYYPAIRSNSAMPDMDNNVWVLPATSTDSKAGELVYDVINSLGALSRRVRLPVGRSVAGFGHGGVVYLLSGDRKTGFYLERYQLDATNTR